MPVLPGEGARTRELYAAIRRLIETGLVGSGVKLPTTRDLARRFGLSRGAAVAAFEMLIADGFAEARIGAGTFVASKVPHLPMPVAPLHSADRYAITPLPCALGVTAPDERTLRVFRSLLTRHLTRPGPEHFHYGDPRGGLGLREALADYLRSARGVRCSASQIIITSGTQQGLDLLARAVIKPRDTVWIEDPCYRMAYAALVNAGGRVVGIPVDGEGLDVARGEALHPKARAVYVTPSHQFPLGVTMTMRRRLALIDWAERNDAWIFEDDYDSEFRYAGPPLAALQGMDAAGRVAYLGTFSKVLFPGLRLGYAVLPAQLMEAMLALRDRSDRQSSTLAEGALTDLLNEGHFSAHLRRTRRRVEVLRDALVAGLQMAGEGRLEVVAPEQGLHLVAKLFGSRKDTDIVVAARAAGVEARALSSLYVDSSPQQGLVLGFSGFTAEQLKNAAATIGTLL